MAILPLLVVSKEYKGILRVARRHALALTKAFIEFPDTPGNPQIAYYYALDISSCS